MLHRPEKKEPRGGSVASSSPWALVTRRNEKEASIESLGDPPSSTAVCKAGSGPGPLTPQALTVIADRASVGSHGAVTGEAIPLLQADALVGTRLFGAGGTGAWKGRRKERPQFSPAPSLPGGRGALGPGPEALPSVLPGQKVGRGGGGLKDC